MPALALTLFGATLITFVISHLIPTDVARLIAGDGASEAVVEGLRIKLGLDQPIWTQYGIYLSNLSRGDLGVSIRTGQPVLEELLRAAPATIELAVTAFLIILIASLALGVWAAITWNRAPDQIIRTLSTIAISSPTFWTALILIGVFAVMLGWAPLGGRVDPELALPPALTGFLVIDALLVGRLDVAGNAIAHLALPALTLALAATGSAIRLIRASLLETLAQDYVRRARAAGLSEWRVMTRYALPNALIPFVTSLGLLLADLIAGAVVTEMIFGWPGLGTYTLEAVAGLDFPAIMGFTLFAALVYAIASFVIDLLNSMLDPRARTGA